MRAPSEILRHVTAGNGHANLVWGEFSARHDAVLIDHKMDEAILLPLLGPDIRRERHQYKTDDEAEDAGKGGTKKRPAVPRSRT